MKISVLLSESEAEVFGAYCKANGFKKSTLIARLIREHLEREQFAVQDSFLTGASGATGVDTLPEGDE